MAIAAQTGHATKLRIGLALGAGGVVGASYLAGALEGIRSATGWEPADADVIVGTSAGAFIAAITAAGVSPALVYARCTGDMPADVTFPAATVALSERMDRHNDAHWTRRYLPPVRVPRPVLASPRLALRALRDAGGARRMARLATGLLGEGLLSSQRSIGAVVHTALARGWPTRPVWIAACDLDRGRRVLFGCPDAPGTDLHLAVSAATAIPGLFAPVTIAGRRYCDAGLCSPSNLDTLHGLGLDAVVCINPLSGGDEPVLPSTGGRLQRSLHRLGRLARRNVDAGLADERRLVERDGTRVFVLHPMAEDLARFPLNAMDLASRPAVMRLAAKTTAAALRDGVARELGSVLRQSARHS